MILIYLAFGKDNPYNIAKFFQTIANHAINDHNRSSVLRYPSRIGTLLNKMMEDELVIMKEVSINGRSTKKYELNPKIIQWLFINRPHIKRDGSVFEIPLEIVKKALDVLEECNEDNKVRIWVLSTAKIPYIIDYFTFLMFFSQMHEDYMTWRNIIDFDRSIPLSYIFEYIQELKYLVGSNYDEEKTHFIRVNTLLKPSTSIF